MRSRFFVRSLLLGTSCAYTLAGCSLRGDPLPTRFYVLTSLPQSERATLPGLTSSATLGVGPVTLPQYTNRTQIVTGATNPELHRSLDAQWAEPLEANFTRVVTDNLSLLLATDQVMTFPWQGLTTPTYQVIIEVTHFLGELGGQASLEARWNIIGRNGNEVLVRRKSSFSEPTAAPDYQSLAAGFSRMVAQLSREIASALIVLGQKERHS